MLVKMVDKAKRNEDVEMKTAEDIKEVRIDPRSIYTRHITIIQSFVFTGVGHVLDFFIKNFDLKEC